MKTKVNLLSVVAASFTILLVYAIGLAVRAEVYALFMALMALLVAVPPNSVLIADYAPARSVEGLPDSHCNLTTLRGRGRPS